MCFPTKKFYHRCLSEQTSHLESQRSCTALLMDMFLMVAASSEVFPLFLQRHLALGDYYNVALFSFGLLSTVRCHLWLCTVRSLPRRPSVLQLRKCPTLGCWSDHANLFPSH